MIPLKSLRTNEILTSFMVALIACCSGCSEQQKTANNPKHEREPVAEQKQTERDAEFEDLAERLSRMIGKKICEIEREIDVVRKTKRQPIEEPWNCLRGVEYYPENNISVSCYFDSEDPLFRRGRDWEPKDLGEGLVAGIQVRKGELYREFGSNIPFQFRIR